MAHVLSFSFATWASEIKFSPGINAYAKQRGSPGYCTGLNYPLKQSTQHPQIKLWVIPN